MQIHGGMGLMDELVLERIWRDARVERIWDGTSEIQRHIISRSMLRAARWLSSRPVIADALAGGMSHAAPAAGRR